MEKVNRFAHRIKAQDYWWMVFKMQLDLYGLDAAEKKANDDHVPVVEIATMIEWARGIGTPPPLHAQSKSTQNQAHIQELEQPVVITPVDLPDEKVLEHLRNFRSNYPQLSAQEFLESRQGVYPNQLHLIEQVLIENGLQYTPNEPAPEPVVETVPPTLSCGATRDRRHARIDCRAPEEEDTETQSWQHPDNR